LEVSSPGEEEMGHEDRKAGARPGSVGSLARSESGQTLPEYVLLVLFVAAVAIAATMLGRAAVGAFGAFDPPREVVFKPPAIECDKGYKRACVPPPPPRLTCDDLRPLPGPIRVVGPDPHELDDDRDGWACD
jgi:Flp pilus assembly pilin Flp